MTDQVETDGDIENYLTTFNKEIQSGPDSKEVTRVFMDESGKCYYHALTEQGVVLMEQKLEPTKEVTINSSLPCILEEEECPLSVHAPDQATDLSILSDSSRGDTTSQLIFNPGDSNQLVTIVPSSSSNGELSYVFIVEPQPEGQDKHDTVYDFNESDEGLTYVNKEICDEEQKKLLRIVPKKSQTSNAVHMCNYCNYTSAKRYLLFRHMKSHSQERPHKCAVCERGFKTLASLHNHVNTHIGIKPHQCKSCESSFTTSGELVRHVRYKHTHEKPHKCPECQYASVELSKLKRHMRCHTGERPYQCPDCTYASPDTFKLKRHIRIHTGEKPYACDVCEAKFTQSNSLKAHRLIHSANKPVYACGLCPTTCGRKTDLRIHIQKLHTSDKPIKCKKCAKSFPDRYTFKQHQKTHDGEKCFKCELCTYASSAIRHLESHMLIHTEQKPYACTECDQAFRHKQLLKRHKNLYHEPNYTPPPPKAKNQECGQCHKAFRHKGNLIRHLSTHDHSPVFEESSSAKDSKSPKKIHLNAQMFASAQDVEDDVMTVEGQDGNQYVVLEVIHLQDAEGNMVIPDGLAGIDNTLSTTGVLTSPLMGTDVLTDSSELLQFHEHKKSMKVQLETEPKKDDRKEMETCFGFDDDEESTQISLQFAE